MQGADRRYVCSTGGRYLVWVALDLFQIDVIQLVIAVERDQIFSCLLHSFFDVDHSAGLQLTIAHTAAGDGATSGRSQASLRAPTGMPIVFALILS